VRIAASDQRMRGETRGMRLRSLATFPTGEM
jgi:hypothetical protein